VEGSCIGPVFTSFTTFMLIPEMTLGHLGVMEEQIAEMSFNAANVCEHSGCYKS